MVFKKLLQAVGIGGPSVETVLREGARYPGHVLQGEVRIGGGSDTADIERITLVLVVETEGADEQPTTVEFHRIPVAGAFRLVPEHHHNIPFDITLPWETPITALRGHALPGMRVGLRTEVAVAQAVDSGDMDPVWVEPLPSQLPIIDAMPATGAQLKSADVEQGAISGLRQSLPFYQEIEFLPPPAFAGGIGRIELTFVTRQDSFDVVLEADKRGGLLTPGGDVLGRFHTSHHDSIQTDWIAAIQRWLTSVSGGNLAPGPHGGPAGHQGHGTGVGVGGVIAGGAAGFVGGMVAGEALDEIGEEIFGEEQ